jgi:fatty-acyl-CoA synthase
MTGDIGPGPLSYEPLTPVAFLERAAAVHAGRTAVIDGDLRLTYRELHDRARRLSGAIIAEGAGHPVAVLAPNTHVLLEAHYGVPWAGVPLVALNVRLRPEELSYIVDHSEATTLLYDHELAGAAAAIAAAAAVPLRLVRVGGDDDQYEPWLAAAVPRVRPVADERGLLSLNYTSGTTGKPKGVMYHHRGAYLQSLAMVAHTGLGPDSVMLWTLPMFHCNGWCFPWATTAAGATHVCLRRIDPDEVWRLVDAEGVTHLNAAPTVLISLAYAASARPLPPGRSLAVGTGGAPPTPTLLARLGELGMHVTHLYGLTETFGPAVVCEWRAEWSGLDQSEQARLKARQGVANLIARPVRVVDGAGRDVRADGDTPGQIALAGNNVMLGYYKDPEATARAAPDGWFRTGDIGVMHPDGYIELRDREKDVIISGGENIASVEVEQVVASHPAVREVAVIAHPDAKWGEVPVAYVTLHDGASATAEEIIAFARDRLARFKAPKDVVFTELPKTSTGKVQKFVLRDKAWAGRDRRIN